MPYIRVRIDRSRVPAGSQKGINEMKKESKAERLVRETAHDVVMSCMQPSVNLRLEALIAHRRAVELALLVRIKKAIKRGEY